MHGKHAVQDGSAPQHWLTKPHSPMNAAVELKEVPLDQLCHTSAQRNTMQHNATQRNTTQLMHSICISHAQSLNMFTGHDHEHEVTYRLQRAFTGLQTKQGGLQGIRLAYTTNDLQLSRGTCGGTHPLSVAMCCVPSSASRATATLPWCRRLFNLL